MILITGTKRSGTSMWMQILKSAGYKVMGDIFPNDWKESIRKANQKGFFESHFRKGIYYQTNPHPKTGQYFTPAETENVAVKVFIPGLIKTDLAFVNKVIGTIRDPREYTQSLTRLYTLEHRAKENRRGVPFTPPARILPALEWWMENFALVSDFLTRRYKVYLVAYSNVIKEPEPIVTEIINWLGKGDTEAAVKTVDPALNEIKNGSADEIDLGLEPEVVAVFDELYSRIQGGGELDKSFIKLMNETHHKLAPRIIQARKIAQQDHVDRMRKLRKSTKPQRR